MKSILILCLLLITASCIYTAVMLSGSNLRLAESHEKLIKEHEANVKSYGIIAIKALDERNLAEAHVTYLQQEIAKWHKSTWKEIKK